MIDPVCFLQTLFDDNIDVNVIKDAMFQVTVLPSFDDFLALLVFLVGFFHIIQLSGKIHTIIYSRLIVDLKLLMAFDGRQLSCQLDYEVISWLYKS